MTFMGSICPKCGKNNNDGARFCTACGVSLTDPGTRNQDGEPYRQNDSSYPGGYPDQTGPIPENRYSERGRDPEGGRTPYPMGGKDGGSNGGNGARKALLVFAAVISLLIITLSIVLLRSRLSDHSTADSNTTTSGQKAREGEKTTSEATSSASTTATESASQTATENYEDVDLQETDKTSEFEFCNNRYINILKHERTEDFQTMTSRDGSFSFSYPKYIFNHVEVNEDGSEYFFTYRNEYGEDEFILRYSRTYDPGNAKDKVMGYQEDYMNTYYRTTYKYDYKREKNNGLQHIAIASGDYTESASRGQYALVENDGECTYRMEFEYDECKGSENNHLQYIINNVYRQCSFAMSRKKPVSYEKMLKEEGAITPQ